MRNQTSYVWGGWGVEKSNEEKAIYSWSYFPSWLLSSMLIADPLIWGK